MGSREKILAAIKQAKPAIVPYTPFSFSINDTINVLEEFVHALTSVGAQATIISNLKAVDDIILEQLQKGLFVINSCDQVCCCNISEVQNYSAFELSTVDTVVVKGSIAVTENGAIWLTEASIKNRLLPFICQHLIIIINEANIVANMNEAYDRITIDDEGYGVFIAGPSKTADIEQSLVVGAHGALSLQVFILA
ncbi:MAG: lactate utilization protein [Segetibacter sp.]|nr:lactate utilization protein [Segetibacter sp.]